MQGNLSHLRQPGSGRGRSGANFAWTSNRKLDRECEHCGGTYTTVQRSQRYCSLKCRRLAAALRLLERAMSEDDDAR